MKTTSQHEVKWICSQFGGREKYAIPRALQANDKLHALYTDLWVDPQNGFGRINKKARGRFHSDLRKAVVHSFNARFLYWKVREAMSPKTQFDLDDRYDELVSRAIAGSDSGAGYFFGYSYSSRKSLKAAKGNGLQTVLGQINPGPLEADLVIEEYKKFHGGRYEPFVPSAHYWDLWREEIGVADKVIVNSEWSAKLLAGAGVSRDKMHIIPLAYEERVSISERRFSEKFETKRPLKLLYLGGLELRKGVHILIEAMRSLVDHPVHLDLVGVLKSPEVLLQGLPGNITYHGSVSPADISKFYSNADLFVFPTLSDGFGLTLLESQAHKLPVLASANCAHVIVDNQNGLVLKRVDKQSIVESVIRVLDTPGLLPEFSGKAVSMTDFSIEALASNLKLIER